MPRIANAPVRLVDGRFDVMAGSPESSRSRIERVAPLHARKWPIIETALGPRRRSPPFRTRTEAADALVLEIQRGELEAVDVTIGLGAETLTDAVRFHRTVRLDFPQENASTHTFEIALQPLLNENWQDELTSATEFYMEVDAELSLTALRRIEVHPRSARFKHPAARTLDGPVGSLRPSFYLRSGATIELPVATTNQRRTLSFYLYAPIGEPSVSVGLADLPSILIKASGEDWAHHEIEIPPGVGGKLRFEAGVDGVALVGDPTLWPRPRSERPPDVIIYLVDTLLASRIGALGSGVPSVSPTMDALVDGGLTFVRATSTSPWTKPAIASLLTGVYPLTHRIGARNYTDRVPDGAPMLQERFREAGFRTISSSASPLGSTLSGLERGFDLAHPPTRWTKELGPLGHPSARQVQAALFSFIDEDPSKPVFGYLHTLEVHEYGRPMFAEGPSNETTYDRAIRYQDAALGELLEAYAARRRDVVLVLLSDHGEGFGEYGLRVGHGYSLRQNQLHIPLVFHAPGWLPRGRVAEPASLVDIAPTVLDLYSLPPLPGAQGRSLLPGTTEPPAAVFAERTWYLWEPEGPKLLARVGADGRKLVTGRARPVVWDLAKSACEDTAHFDVDQGELADLGRFSREQQAAAAWWDAMYGASEPPRIDPGDVARLRALGYLK